MNQHNDKNRQKQCEAESLQAAAVAEKGAEVDADAVTAELLAEGKSLSGVAHELIIAEGTAKAHTRHIYEKLGINTRQELLDLLMTEQ